MSKVKKTNRLKSSSGGRPRRVEYTELGFEYIKYGKTYKAKCNFCDALLKNTAISRLQLHRKSCRNKQFQSDNVTPSATHESQHSTTQESHMPPTQNNDGILDISAMEVIVLDNNIVTEEILYDPDIPSTSKPKNNLKKSCANEKPRTKSKNIPLDSYIDSMSEKEEGIITQAIAHFFFACNIPFNVIESKYFVNMITKLRPAYAKKIPTRKALSTNLLDSVYKDIISSTQLDVDSVILIDGWKNSSSNTKTVTCTLNSVDGPKTFLNAWDVTSESETSQKLCTIVSEAINLARDTYNTNVYAVVSDNASAMVKMGKEMKHCLWHSTCNSHTANLLAKDVQDVNCSNKVTMILKEFKRSDLEKSLVEKGGSRIQLPCETRWCTYRDSYKCFLKNLQHMRIIAAEVTNEKKLKQNVVSIIFDDNFVNEVRDNLTLYEPICELINNCQSQSTSVADAVHYWLELKLPENFREKFSEKLKARKTMALNIYALTAYYLHPVYKNNKLSSQNMSEVNNFLFKSLSSDGCDEWDNYKREVNIFKELREKHIIKPLLYWRMAAMYCKELPQLAIKLLQIPASSGEIERVFSNWGYIHSPIRNRLSFEKSKKLVHIYYTLKMADNNSIVFDDDED